MPYRRALQYQSANAVVYQKSRGALREDLHINLDDWDIASDFAKKPDVERWLHFLTNQSSVDQDLRSKQALSAE